MKKPSKTANEYKNLEKSLGIPKHKPLDYEGKVHESRESKSFERKEKKAEKKMGRKC